VDDTATNRTILEHYLQAWGLQCEGVATPSAALNILERASREGMPFELALLDFHMPEMDGLELARAIRERPALSELRLVMLSSAPLRRAPQAGAGVSAFLVKPVSQSDLYDAIVCACPAGAECENERQPSADLGGQLVLVAEDNEINSVVARALLGKRGLRAQIAHNGREAVEMALSGDYAAIFMDCHMPELDGYEATRRIRAAERERRVPIIAMTALSMPGDRERCLAAGMDDYISKPLRNEQLEDVIVRWLSVRDNHGAPNGSGGAASGADGATAGSSGPARGSSIVSSDSGGAADNGSGADHSAPAAPAVAAGEEELERIEVLDEAALSQLRNSLPAEMIGELIDTFERQLARCLSEIESAVNRGDHRELRRLAHLLKGSSATFGASRVRAICLRLEHSGRDGDPVVGDAQVAQLRLAAEHARVALRERLG
jgi:CheY-like chemotaxis protein